MQNENDFISRLAQVRQSQKDFVGFIMTLGFRPGTIIDVGVATGTPEIYDLSDDAMLVLVEPVIEFKKYIENIQKSRNALVYFGAASSKDGEADLWITPDMSTSSLMTPMNATNDAYRRKVPSLKLDTLLRKDSWPKPYLLKIDVQGAELDVMEGAAEVLKHSEIVLLEASLFAFSPGLPDLFMVVSYMKQMGFVVYDLFNGHNRPLDGARAQVDVAFVKENGVFRKDKRWGSPEQCRKFLECKFSRNIYRNLNPGFVMR